MKPRISAERLRELVHYDPATGVFTWLPRPLSEFNGKEQLMRLFNRRFAGTEAGCKRARYTTVRLDNKSYWAHRLVWLYVFGRWPEALIDHRNGDPYDNRLLNLREADSVLNAENRRRPMKGKKLGLPLGVEFHPHPGLQKPYMARIRSRGVQTFLGCYATPDEAAAAYVSAKRRLHEGNTL